MPHNGCADVVTPERFRFRKWTKHITTLADFPTCGPIPCEAAAKGLLAGLKKKAKSKAKAKARPDDTKEGS